MMATGVLWSGRVPVSWRHGWPDVDSPGAASAWQPSSQRPVCAHGMTRPNWSSPSLPMLKPTTTASTWPAWPPAMSLTHRTPRASYASAIATRITRPPAAKPAPPGMPTCWGNGGTARAFINLHAGALKNELLTRQSPRGSRPDEVLNTIPAVGVTHGLVSTDAEMSCCSSKRPVSSRTMLLPL